MDLSGLIDVLNGTPGDVLSSGQTGLTLAGLFWASAIEYLCPVFPGDTVTLAGAILVVTHGLPAWGVFAATMFGGLAGSAVHFWIGRIFRRAERRADDRTAGRKSAFARMLSAFAGSLLHKARKVSDRFAVRGTLLLVGNRFMPGIRSALFVAAGMSGMSWTRAMLAGALSSALWTVLLVFVGMQLGARLDRISWFFRTYSIAAWSIIAAAILAWIVVRVIRRNRQRH